MSIITLLTDFGDRDYYAAALHGVLLSQAPAARTVDISHRVAAGDIAGAGWLLDAASRWFPDGTVHLAVVDPGVGSSRRMIATRCDGHFFVAPDNGLLSRVLGKAASAVIHRIERPDLYLEGEGHTFAGRDRFAPVAAAIARGEPLEALGPEISDPVLLPEIAPLLQGDMGVAGTRMEGTVVHIDRYGNVVTNLPTEWVGDRGCRTTVRSQNPEGRPQQTTARAGHYEEILPGSVALLPGSLGTLELALKGADLAKMWGVRRGDRVEILLLP